LARNSFLAFFIPLAKTPNRPCQRASGLRSFRSGATVLSKKWSFIQFFEELATTCTTKSPIHGIFRDGIKNAWVELRAFLSIKNTINRRGHGFS
jgi:hypothetical protein